MFNQKYLNMIKLIDSPIKYTLLILAETIACWRFKENVEDSTDNLNNLTLAGNLSASSYYIGKTEPNKTALKFNNNDYCYISASSASSFEMGDTDFSIEFWINHSSSASYPKVIQKGSYGDGWYVQANNNGSFTLVMDSQSLTTLKNYSFNEWHYVVFTIDSGNEAKVYVDGELDNTLSSLSIISGNSTNDLIIGSSDSGESLNGYLDEILIHSNKILTASEISYRYEPRKDLRTFSKDKNRISLYHQKYTKPVSKIEFCNTVYNIPTYGIRADWKVKNNNIYSTVYSGNVPHVKFYYGMSMPETLVGYKSIPQWKVNYTGFFRPPITANYTFYLAGEGNLSYNISSESGNISDSNIDKDLSDSSYYSTTFPLNRDSAYSFDFGYELNRNEESAFIVLWKTDSASVTPEKILLSGGVCNPSNNNSVPLFHTVTGYLEPNYSVNSDNISTFKFKVPFISSTNNYDGKGFYYDTVNSCWTDLNNKNVNIKEYKMIRYYEGYQNSDGEDELVCLFTGQIRSINEDYSSKGDLITISCNDYSIFTKDAINLQSPTPIDYWQVGYLENNPGRVNGITKPQTFDGWEIHKMFNILLTESYIDNYSFYQKKEHLNFYGLATTGGFYVEPLESDIVNFLPINRKYGIEPIGEYDNSNVDDEYAYSIDAGEYFQDSIDDILKSWYYKWGVNRYGYPYLKRIQVPNSYVDSKEVDYYGNWSSAVSVSAFKGTYLYSTSPSYATSYTFLNLDNVIKIYDTYNYGSQIYRTGYTLTNESQSNVGFFNFDAYYPFKNIYMYVSLYCTSNASTNLVSTSWRFLSSCSIYRGANNYEFNINSEHFSRAKSLGIQCNVNGYLTPQVDELIEINSKYLNYNSNSDSEYLTGSYLEADVVGKKFALLIGRGPSCGSSNPDVHTFKVKLYKNNAILVNASVNPYDDEDRFYYDEPNYYGINKSYINVGNGLPYDSYKLQVENLSSAYEVRIEGILEYEEDYNVPIDTIYPDDSVKKGSIVELSVDRDAKDQRNDCVVLGKRVGTLLQYNDDGEEIIINPNNETNIYVQSGVRDLNSIYNSSASNYVGRPKTTIIIDSSILNEDHANFVGLNFISEYSNPYKNATFSIVGNPTLEIDDCIVVNDSFKYGITPMDYMWIDNISSNFSNKYITRIQTVPTKPITSYWSRPVIDINDFNGVHIYNLKINNRGIWSNLVSNITTDTGLSVNNTLTATSASYAIPDMGYLRIGKELIKYESVTINSNYIYFGNLTRGLGEDGVTYNHYTNDYVVSGYNAYSKKQSPPVIEFDLLVDANVAVHINSYRYLSANNMRISFDQVKVDSLTDIEGDLNEYNYEYLPAGHYEFVWGGWDRRGIYNDFLLEKDIDFTGSNFFANENYKLPYKVATSGPYNNTVTETYDTGFGMFMSEIYIIPYDEEIPYKYDSIGSDRTDYLVDSSGLNSTIKTVMNDAGTVDLFFHTAGMKVVEPNNTVHDGDFTYKYYSFTDPVYNRNPGGIKDDCVNATNYPMCLPVSFSFTTPCPVFIFDDANLNDNGIPQGFKWEIKNYSPANDEDISRYYIPSIHFKIVQMAYAQLDDFDPKINFFTEITEGKMNEYENISRIKFDTPYYFNIQKILEKEQKGFIPSNALTSFKEYTPSENIYTPMAVSNYTIFVNTLYDLSGRKAKQRRTFEYDEEDTVVHNFGVVNSNYWYNDPTYILYVLQNLTPKIPYRWTSDTANRGMYEFPLIGEKDLSWIYSYYLSDGYNINRYDRLIAFKESETNEYQINRDTIYDFPIGRSNFISWLDESLVREVIFFDMDDYTKDGMPAILLEETNNQKIFLPHVWALFRRGDFSG